MFLFCGIYSFRGTQSLASEEMSDALLYALAQNVCPFPSFPLWFRHSSTCLWVPGSPLPFQRRHRRKHRRSHVLHWGPSDSLVGAWGKPPCQALQVFSLRLLRLSFFCLEVGVLETDLEWGGGSRHHGCRMFSRLSLPDSAPWCIVL